MIGMLGTICGEHGVNIANFTLGRSKAQSEAIAMLYVDDEFPQSAIDALKATGKFRQVQPLEFDVA